MSAEAAVLILILAGMVLPFLVHLALTRLGKFFTEPTLRQKGAVLSGPLGLIPLLGLFCLLMVGRAGTGTSLAWTALYVFASYACFSYVYFHLFNMSETARRIRILVQGRESGTLPDREMSAQYTPEAMIALRLNRLVSLRELRIRDGRYLLEKRGLLGLLLPARMVFALRSFLFPEGKH